MKAYETPAIGLTEPLADLITASQPVNIYDLSDTPLMDMHVSDSDLGQSGTEGQ